MRKIFVTLVGAVLLLTGLAFPTAAQAASKVIYLTFDDGPSDPADTRAVLDALAKYNVKATFFMLGQEVQQHPKTFMRVVNGGHEIANHTWDHPHLRNLSSTAVRSQLTRTQTAEGKYRGKCWRPPYGESNTRVDGIAKNLGLRKVLWNIDPEDWRRPSPTTISNRVTSRAYNGAIVLMHDGGGDGDNTAKALLIMIPKLKKMGYTFKVVPNCS